MAEFKVVSPFEPQGDQPQAIDTLANGGNFPYPPAPDVPYT